MGIIKLIGGVLSTILVAYALIGGISFYSSVADSSVKIVQGDSSAAEDLSNAIADEAVGTVEYSIVMYVIIALAVAIGAPASIIAILRRNS